MVCERHADDEDSLWTQAPRIAPIAAHPQTWSHVLPAALEMGCSSSQPRASEQVVAQIKRANSSFPGHAGSVPAQEQLPPVPADPAVSIRLDDNPARRVSDEVMNELRLLTQLPRSLMSPELQVRMRSLSNELKELKPRMRRMSNEFQPRMRRISNELQPRIRRISNEFEPRMRRISNELQPRIRRVSKELQPRMRRISNELLQMATLQMPLRTIGERSADHVDPRFEDLIRGGQLLAFASEKARKSRSARAGVRDQDRTGTLDFPSSPSSGGTPGTPGTPEWPGVMELGTPGTPGSPELPTDLEPDLLQAQGMPRGQATYAAHAAAEDDNCSFTRFCQDDWDVYPPAAPSACTPTHAPSARRPDESTRRGRPMHAPLASVPAAASTSTPLAAHRPGQTGGSSTAPTVAGFAAYVDTLKAQWANADEATRAEVVAYVDTLKAQWASADEATRTEWTQQTTWASQSL